MRNEGPSGPFLLKGQGPGSTVPGCHSVTGAFLSQGWETIEQGGAAFLLEVGAGGVSW